MHLVETLKILASFVRKGDLSIFRPESELIFPTNPDDILLNYRKSQTRSDDILHEVENLRPCTLLASRASDDLVGKF